MPEFNGVFEGGGVRGIALVGALKRLEEEGIVFSAVAGTSAGALVAALYAVGYTSDELKEILEKTQFAALVEPSPGRLRASWRLWRRYGIHEGRKLYEWIYKHLHDRQVVHFSDIKGPGKRELRIVASDLTTRSPVVFQDGDNNVQVAEAVRMSAGIPFFFQAYPWGNRLVVDGGLLSNYPIWVFQDSPRPTIGLKLVASQKSVVPQTPRTLRAFLTALVTTMMEAHDKQDEKRMAAASTIHIPTGDVRATDFDLSEKQISDLYNSGYVAASEFLRSSMLPGHPAASKKGAPKAELPAPPSLNREIYESLERLRTAGANVMETDLEVERVERILEIRRPDAVLRTVEVSRNVSDKALVAVRRVAVGDAPADFEKLDFRAWVQINDGEEHEAAVEPAALEKSHPKDGRTFQIHIGFRGLVANKGDRLRLRWQFRWPGSVARREDYWVFRFGYSQGVKEAQVAVLFRGGAPADYGFYDVTPSGHRPIGLPGLLVMDDDGEPAYSCGLAIEHPNEFYLLRWRLT